MQSKSIQIHRRWFLSLVGMFLILACNNPFPKKLDAGQWVEAESERIDWRHPDVYPLFDSCDELAAPNEQYNCFTEVYTHHLHDYLSKNFAYYNSFSDTLKIELSIDTLGDTQVRNLTHSRFDRVLDSLVRNTKVYLPKIYPARKRNLPVQSSMKLSVALMIK